jgi:DNA-binding CsgD family transcriptional regulator
LGNGRWPLGARLVTAGAPMPKLSKRHVEIVVLIGRDQLSNKAVAKRLGITKPTLRSHLATICARIGAGGQSREAIIGFYWRFRGKLDPSAAA